MPSAAQFLDSQLAQPSASQFLSERLDQTTSPAIHSIMADMDGAPALSPPDYSPGSFLASTPESMRPPSAQEIFARTAQARARAKTLRPAQPEPSLWGSFVSSLTSEGNIALQNLKGAGQIVEDKVSDFLHQGGDQFDQEMRGLINDAEMRQIVANIAKSHQEIAKASAAHPAASIAGSLINLPSMLINIGSRGGKQYHQIIDRSLAQGATSQQARDKANAFAAAYLGLSLAPVGVEGSLVRRALEGAAVNSAFPFVPSIFGTGSTPTPKDIAVSAALGGLFGAIGGRRKPKVQTSSGAIPEGLADQPQPSAGERARAMTRILAGEAEPSAEVPLRPETFGPVEEQELIQRLRTGQAEVKAQASQAPQPDAEQTLTHTPTRSEIAQSARNAEAVSSSEAPQLPRSRLEWGQPTPDEAARGYARVAIIPDREGRLQRVGFNDTQNRADLLDEGRQAASTPVNRQSGRVASTEEQATYAPGPRAGQLALEDIPADVKAEMRAKGLTGAHVMSDESGQLQLMAYDQNGNMVNLRPVTPPETRQAAPTQIVETQTGAGGGEPHRIERPIVRLPVADLTLSKDVPQFKAGANEKGIVEAIGGTIYDERGTGPIQVWRRENADLEVISGRHRFEHARKVGKADLPAQVYNEADGFTASNAATLDAELNIRDGQGTGADYAQFFKDSGITQEAAEQRGLLARAKGRRAYATASVGSDSLLSAYRAGKLSDDAAYAISQAAPGNEALQAVGMRAVADGQSIQNAANLMRAVATEAQARGQSTADLFGFDDSAMRQAEAMAKAATAHQRQIAERLSAITGASKRPKLAKKEGVNVNDPEALKRRIDELKTEKVTWEHWQTDPEKVAFLREATGQPEPGSQPPDLHSRAQSDVAESATTPGVVRRSLAKTPLGRQFAALEDAGVLSIKNQPGAGWKGRWDGHKAVLNAAYLDEADALPTAFHELTHATLHDMVGDQAWGRIVNDIQAIGRGHDEASAIVRKAQKRVREAGVSARQHDEELVAHTVDEAIKEGKVWRRSDALNAVLVRLFNRVRAWAKTTRLGEAAQKVGHPLKFTPTDLSALVESAIRRLAKTAIETPESVDFAPETARFSRSTRTRETYDRRIDELLSGAKAKRPGVRVLDRSDVLAMLRFGDGPVTLSEGKVQKGVDNHPQFIAAHWKKVPEWLDNPAAVFDSDTHPGERLVFIAPEKVNDSPVRIIVEHNSKGDGSNVHLLINAFDSGQRNPFARWLNDGLLKYVDRKEAAALGKSFLPRLSGLLARGHGSNKRILQRRDLVKYRAEHAEPLYSRAIEEGRPEPVSRAPVSAIPAPAPVAREIRQLFDQPFPLKSGKLDTARYWGQDRLIDLKRIQEGVERQARRAIEDRANPYQAEELFHGKTASEIEDFRRDVTESLIDFIHRSGLGLKEIGAWLTARHAKERNARIREINPDERKGAGMTDAEAHGILSKYAGNEALQNIGKLTDWLVAEQRKLLVESGLETVERVAGWRAQYEHYVPLKGFEDEALAGEAHVKRGTGMGFDVRGREKRAFGRVSRSANPLANLLTSYERTIVRANKAEVGRALLRLAEAHPNKDLWEINKVEYQPRIDKDSGLVVYGPDPTYKFNDNVINVKVGGEDYTLTMHGKIGERFAKAFKNLQPDMQGVVLRGLSHINRYLAMVNTSLNPEFMISNFARDIQTAFINLTGTEIKAKRHAIVKDVPKALAGMREMLRKETSASEWGKYADEFRHEGGMTMWLDAHHDVQKLTDSLSKRLRRAGQGKLHPTRIFTVTGKFIEDYNKIVENGIRLSTYVHARRAGLSKAKAASLAKNLTVNFNRKGQLGPAINALYLFFNASVQGSTRTLLALKYPAVRRLVYGIIATSAGLSITNRIVGGEDEDGVAYYDKIPDYVKERNLIIMLPPWLDLPDWMESVAGGGKYISIPLPYGYNTFKDMGDAIGDALSVPLGYKQHYEPMKGVMSVVNGALSGFNPLGTSPLAAPAQFISPSVADPFVQIWTGKTWYGGPLYPDKNPFANVPLPDTQRYWSSTSQLSKILAGALGKATGGDKIVPGVIDISPNTLDMLWNTLTGGAGATLNRSISTAAALSSGAKSPVGNIPFVRRVLGETQVRRWDRQTYYDNLTRIGQAQKELEAAQSPAERKAVVQRWRAWLQSAPAAKGAEKALRHLRELQDKAESMPAGKHRDKTLERIEDAMHRVRLQLNIIAEDNRAKEVGQ